MKVIDLAQKAKTLGLILVLDRRGKARLRHYLRAGDTRIAVKVKR